MAKDPWRPRHDDPLFIMAMDHRDSFGTTLFHVAHGSPPTPEQAARMRAAKELIYGGLSQARLQLTAGRAGVLVDEDNGRAVIDRARHDGVTLAVPIEASGHEWFEPESGEQWLEHVTAIGPDYAKVLVRDNPDLPEKDRRAQLDRLAEVSAGLRGVGVPLLYELLVPGTPAQMATVDNDVDRYDRDVRPALVARVIGDNQAAGVEPTLWKVEGLDTAEGAALVAEQARAGGRDADLIVLGRDAPVERLDRWLRIASAHKAFVGFAIGRSIWEDVVRDWAEGEIGDEVARQRVADRYLGFVRDWL
jgi:myo-inositol catabolism protein IolC